MMSYELTRCQCAEEGCIGGESDHPAYRRLDRHPSV